MYISLFLYIYIVQHNGYLQIDYEQKINNEHMTVSKLNIHGR